MTGDWSGRDTKQAHSAGVAHAVLSGHTLIPSAVTKRRSLFKKPLRANLMSDLFLPSRFRKANQLPLTVKPQTYQPNTFLKVLFEAVSTSY